jgi:hypothetical protein
MKLQRLLPLCSLLTALSAQQMVLSDGNMNFATTDPSLVSQLPRALNLRADALAIDHGFEHWWYYRVAGDPAELALRSLGGVTNQVTPNNDHGDRDFGDVDLRGLLKASLDFDIYDSGPASGVVISRLTVMNRSASPVTVDLFAYTDLDIAGSSGNDVCTGTASSHFVTDPSGVQIEVRALGNDRHDALGYPAIRNALTNLTVDNLTNTLPAFTGDYTGAFQWSNRTLQPFEERTFQVVFAVDTAATILPLNENYGAGNSSTMQIHSVTLPLQDNTQTRTYAVQIKNALPNSEYRIAIGLQPWNALPFIPGIDLYVDPANLILIDSGFATPSGDFASVFFIPPSPYLAGFSIYSQGFAVNAAAPNGFAWQTAAMRTRVGKL